MKKLILLLGVVFITNCYATTPLNLSVLSNALQKQKTSNSEPSTTLIYGGQDISHSRIAIA